MTWEGRLAQRREAQDPEVPPILVVLGANVYRRRVLRVPKMSQDRLAELADVAVSTIQAIESGRDPSKPVPPYPQLDTIEKLAQALGCSVDDLLRWDPATPSYLSGKSRLGPKSHPLRVLPTPRSTDSPSSQPAVVSKAVRRVGLGGDRAPARQT